MAKKKKKLRVPKEERLTVILQASDDGVDTFAELGEILGVTEATAIKYAKDAKVEGDFMTAKQKKLAEAHQRSIEAKREKATKKEYQLSWMDPAKTFRRIFMRRLEKPLVIGDKKEGYTRRRASSEYLVLDKRLENGRIRPFMTYVTSETAKNFPNSDLSKVITLREIIEDVLGIDYDMPPRFVPKNADIELNEAVMGIQLKLVSYQTAAGAFQYRQNGGQPIEGANPWLHYPTNWISTAIRTNHPELKPLSINGKMFFTALQFESLVEKMYAWGKREGFEVKN